MQPLGLVRYFVSQLLCPVCGASFVRSRLYLRPFRCPTCRADLEYSIAARQPAVAGAILLAGAAAYASGARNFFSLSLVFFIAWMPAVFVAQVINAILFPPGIQPSGGFKGVLYGPQSGAAHKDTSASARVEASHEITTPETTERDPLTPPRPQPRTLEGLLLGTGAVVFTVGWLWMSVEPWLARNWPGYETVMSGPPLFPVSVRIGQHAAVVVNDSDEDWACQSTFGGTEDRASFNVGARRSHSIVYMTLPNVDNDEKEDAVRVAAREGVEMICTTPAGQRHYYFLSSRR